MSIAIAVTEFPPCDFCTLEGRKKVLSGVYDFKTKDGPWANGCQEHFVAHRAFVELGTGKGQKRFLNPPQVAPPRPKGEHLTRFQELLKQHGTIGAVIDATGGEW